MSVIITNARNRVAYNAVRSLGRRGIRVHCADFAPGAMSFASRYCAGHFVHPSPYTDAAGFIECLLDQIGRLGTEVLIPVHEETFLIAKHAERLVGRTATVMPTYNQILLAHNKDRWSVIASELGIPVPASHSVETLRSGSIPVSDLRFPLLVKPKQGGGGWGIREFRTPEALDAFLDAETYDGLAWDRFFVQEKIAGRTDSVAMLLNRGRLRAKLAYRQIRDFPARGGQATLRVSIRSRRAEEHLQALLEKIEWHGVCQADFVIEESTQTPYLIDMNPRLWGSLSQAIASGVDFPYLLYRLALDGDVEPVTDFKTDVVTRWLGGDLRAFLPHLRLAERKAAFVRDFLFPRPRPVLLDDISLADPLPFCVWAMQVVRRASGWRRSGTGQRESLAGVWE